MTFKAVKMLICSAYVLSYVLWSHLVYLYVCWTYLGSSIKIRLRKIFDRRNKSKKRARESA